MSKPRFSHVFFDFDGVICDSLSTAIDVYNRLRERRYPNLPPVSSQADMVLVYGGSLRTSLDRWLGHGGSPAFWDDHSHDMAGFAASLQTFAGIGRILSSHPPSTASIVTSAYSDAVRTVLERDRDFNNACLYRILGREFHLPKSDKITLVLEDLKLDSSSALYVGDLESDVIYCRKVPIPICAVGYGYHPSMHLATCNPDYLAQTVDELDTLLADLVVGYSRNGLTSAA